MPEFLPERNRISWELPSGSSLDSEGVVIGEGPNALEVAVGKSQGRPASADLHRAWRARLGGRPNPLMVVALYRSKAALCGPGGDPPPIHWDLDFESAEKICDAALREPNRHAARRFIQGVLDSLEDELLGIRNEGLLATHYLRARMPKREDWTVASRKASEVVDRRGRELLLGLRYEIETLPGPAHILLAKDTRVAVAVFLHGGEAFDQQQDRFVGKSPVAYALAQAHKHSLPYVLALTGGRIRLYLADPSAGVAPRGPTETFVEVHLDLLPPKDAGYLWLLFSGEALSSGGTLAEALQKSRDYSADLGKRLRERIYVDVLPKFSRAVAKAVGGAASSKEELDLAHRMAMTLLFRLLFVAYAEDRGLLPFGRNQRYQSRSLKAKAKEIGSVVRDGRGFDPTSASHWTDVFALFRAVYYGNREWDVPEYGGDLFSPNPEISVEGSKLEEIRVSNDVFGPILSGLLLDWTAEGVRGPVDFRSLGVREFGVIYEGLLESELSVAEQALIVDSNGNYVPAKEGEEASIQAGEFYMHNTSGQRKSTGTYYTKDFIVEHLLEHSLEPALNDHLERLESLGDRDAEAAFFDIRVVDIAMGSGHFLVAAIDHIERSLSAYLTERSLPGVEEELDRLREAASGSAADSEDEPLIDDRALLRRQIARRCIYGVDLNPLAVQLARLSLWTHTFVPGLPLSFLNHNLVCGNSIVGIASPEEAASELGLKGDTLLSYLPDDKLEAIESALDSLGKLADADAREIREAREAQTRLESAAAPLQALFDIVTASRVEDSIAPRVALAGSERLGDLIDSKVHKTALTFLDGLRSFHFPAVFPEIFRGSKEGFDVIVGNPPWEKLHVEEHAFWARYYPGFRGLSQTEREKRLPKLRERRPDLVERLETETAAADISRRAILGGPFPGIGASHPDLYKAFSWRFWDLVREDGYVGVVLPRSTFSTKGSEAFRKRLLEAAVFTDLTILVNNQQWVFEDLHPQFTIALTSFQKRSPDDTTAVPLRGPYSSKIDFMEGSRKEPYGFPVPDILSSTDSAALPLLTGEDSGVVFAKIRNAPSLGNGNGKSWGVRPVQGDLNATTGKPLMTFSEKRPGNYWPVYKGASFDLWTPDTGEYYAWGDPDVLLEHLEGKRVSASNYSRSAFHEMKPDWIDDPGTLPSLHPRIAFRDVTNRTNRRTVIVALVPPKTFLVHTAPYLLWSRGDEMDQAYLVGILSSVPLDWYARRFVETHLTFSILDELPVPRPTRANPFWKRIVQIAACLIAPDERFAKWAEAVGEEGGPLSDHEQSDLVHELDAVVACLYGLSMDDVRHIFQTFHEGWDYSDRLEAVLGYYRRWEEKK